MIFSTANNGRWLIVILLTLPSAWVSAHPPGLSSLDVSIQPAQIDAKVTSPCRTRLHASGQLIWWLNSKAEIAEKSLRGCSVMVSLMGTYWLLERTLL